MDNDTHTSPDQVNPHHHQEEYHPTSVATLPRRPRHPNESDPRPETKQLPSATETWYQILEQNPELDVLGDLGFYVVRQIDQFVKTQHGRKEVFHDAHHAMAFTEAALALINAAAADPDNQENPINQLKQQLDCDLDELKLAFALAGLTHDLGNISDGIDNQTGELNYLDHFTATDAESRSQQILQTLSNRFNLDISTDVLQIALQIIEHTIPDFQLSPTPDTTGKDDPLLFKRLVQTIDQSGQAFFNRKNFLDQQRGLIKESMQEGKTTQIKEGWINFPIARLDHLLTSEEKRVIIAIWEQSSPQVDGQSRLDFVRAATQAQLGRFKTLKTSQSDDPDFGITGDDFLKHDLRTHTLA